MALARAGGRDPPGGDHPREVVLGSLDDYRYVLRYVRLTHNNTEDFYPDYSPNGKRIAFAGTGENANHIYTISAHGGDKAKVTEGHYPSYSPDGKKIAYSRGSDRNSAIYTINVGGGGKSRVTEGSNPIWGSRP